MIIEIDTRELDQNIADSLLWKLAAWLRSVDNQIYEDCLVGIKKPPN